MGKIFFTKAKPLEFKDQKEAFMRYMIILFVSTFLVIDSISVNLVSFLLLYSSFKQKNLQFSNWFIATTFLSITLLLIALVLFFVPILPLRRVNDNDLILGKDFISISKELYKPTKRGYKINGMIRSISYLIGIPLFFANMILIIVGFFAI